jgi:signal transduction histidine kinase
MSVRSFSAVPIRLKLTGMIVAVSSLTLILAAIAIVAYEATTSRARLADDLRGLADVVGLNTRAAIEFDDPDAAAENLQALAARQAVMSAAIYTVDGRLFATFERTAEAGLPALLPAGMPLFTSRALELTRAVGHPAEPIGWVSLRADLAPLQARSVNYALIVAAMLVVLLIASLGLAVILQRVVSTPLLDLAGVARGITERRDFGMRAQKRSNDELGLLTDALNQMLDRIQHQHRELEQEVAERKLAESRVRSLNAELEQRVAARTAELQTANEELEGFSYSVSHGLRAPLRGIDGFVRILEEEYGPALDVEARRLISVVRSNCDAMRQLIDDLLSFSRLGRQGLTMAPVDMNGLVEEVLTELGQLPDEPLAAVDVAPLPSAVGDRGLLRLVWFNLLANANKFTRGRKDAKVRVSGDRKDGEVLYSVADNGVGFDMRYYDKLFGVFQRLHRAEEFGGTGVGLATFKRIITRHGGRVWAEGRVGEGATFYFSLPAGEPDG